MCNVFLNLIFQRLANECMSPLMINNNDSFLYYYSFIGNLTTILLLIKEEVYNKSCPVSPVHTVVEMDNF